MKRILIAICVLLLFKGAKANIKPFKIAFLSDTHIGAPNSRAEEDLRRTVADINQMTDVAFVVVTGDVTELGTDAEIKLAKQLLDSLRIPYYVIPGNHDTGWSESGGLSFTKIFGYDKFSFEYNGVRFLGCASGPYVRMSDGHIPRDAILWIDNELLKLSSTQPIVFLNHYPLDNSLDNWYEVTDRLNKKNALMVMCGHGHTNKVHNFEGIPGIMGRSNLRAKAIVGGYNIVSITNDSASFTEHKPGTEYRTTWHQLGFRSKPKNDTIKVRPDFAVNNRFSFIKPKWTYSSDANVISTPAVFNNVCIVGNSNGLVEALSLKNGKVKWSFKTGGPIYSSPVVHNNLVILGSSNGVVYCLNAANGKLVWKVVTGASVLGSPIVKSQVVFVGGSDHSFRALDVFTGKERWRFNGLNGAVVSKPLIVGDTIIFGAWDKYLYALSVADGRLFWKWTNGSTVINYSPAACIPVENDGVVYVVAPDRYLTAIDLTTGETLWRNNGATVRESIGISNDGKTIYAKTMNDDVVAFRTSRSKQPMLWKMNCDYGYDHVPSMLIEKESQVFFGTRNGVVYSIDPLNQKVVWKHKIDNSMINTVNVIDARHVVASTMDGKIVLLVIN